MAEYIEREAAYAKLTEYYYHRTEVQHKALQEALERTPAADVNPVVQGHWIEDEYKWTCSHCGESFGYYDNGFLQHGYFCPNCGADMRGNKDESKNDTENI